MLILPAFRTLSSRPPGIGERPPRSLHLPAASLAAGRLLRGRPARRRRARVAPPLLVHAPTAIAATASTTKGRRPRRRADPSMYSSMTHRSNGATSIRPRDVVGCAAVSQDSTQSARIGHRAPSAVIAAVRAPSAGNNAAPDSGPIGGAGRNDRSPRVGPGISCQEIRNAHVARSVPGPTGGAGREPAAAATRPGTRTCPPRRRPSRCP